MKAPNQTRAFTIVELLFLKSQEKTENTINSLAEEIREQNKNFRWMESDIATLKNINNVLSKPVFSSEREVWRNTQYFQRECVEISGIPASVDHKELEPSVCKVPQHIGVDITEERIESYHHVNRSRVRTILKFSKRNDSQKVMR